MALTVETGMGVVGADSFASVEDADAFWSARGDAGNAWLGLTTSTKEAALTDATDYVSLRLSRGGSPLNDNQGLAWPWADTDVTARAASVIRRATILVADIARLGPLSGGASQQGRVLSQSKTLGPLSKSVTYADRSAPPSANGRDLGFIDDMLSQVGAGGGGLVIGTSARA